MIDEQLGLHDLNFHNEEGQATRDMTPRAVIYIYEIALLDLEGVVDCSEEMIIQNQVKGSTEMLDKDLVSIQEAKDLVRVDVLSPINHPEKART